MEPRIQYVKTEDGVSIAYWTRRQAGAEACPTERAEGSPAEGSP